MSSISPGKDIPIPTRISLNREQRFLRLYYGEEKEFQIPHLLLRAFSPSADVGGLRAEAKHLQMPAEEVSIEAIEAVGNYAIRLVFDDGHSTGLYTWEHLYELGENLDRYQELLQSSRQLSES